MEIFSTATLFLRFLALFLGDQQDDGEVMLITGGDHYQSLSSVEIFDPSNPSLNCTLPDMNVTRYFHAAAGMTICGDHDDGSQSCETLDGGQWTETHQLHQKRKYHVMWQSPSKGMMIMGGGFSNTTVETLQDDGSSVMQPWNLNYDTVAACSIDLGQTVVITGGVYSTRKVTEYNEEGQSKVLPQLIRGRWSHGCSSYVDKNGNIVLLVTGGWVGMDVFSSTEIQVTRTSEWKQVASYPLSVWGLSGKTLNNAIYMTGGCGDWNYYGNIYQYDAEADQWKLVGKMENKRAGHAVSIIKQKGIFCSNSLD